MNNGLPLHSILGDIDDAMRADLVRLTNGQGHPSIVGDYSSAQTAVLKDIASLQVKAIRTFGDSGDEAWWVTRRGLQQSTIASVAEFKASWYGDASVSDICCGLGCDLIALSKRGPTTAIDRDEDVISFAAANLRVARSDAVLKVADVMQSRIEDLIGDAQFIHLDPDRRVDGKRHTRCEDLIPDWERTESLLNACDGGVVKVAPATQLTAQQTKDFHRMWISTGGSVREQTIIAGDLLRGRWALEHGLQPGCRSAVCLRGGIVSIFNDVVNRSVSMSGSTQGIGEFLVDPNSSIRAAELTESFADVIKAPPVDQFSGFLTCDNTTDVKRYAELVTVSRVLEVVGCDDRKLRRCFRARKAYPALIKVRGADQDPAALTKRLRTCGETPLGLWIGRNGKRTFAAITELPS